MAINDTNTRGKKQNNHRAAEAQPAQVVQEQSQQVAAAEAVTEQPSNSLKMLQVQFRERLTGITDSLLSLMPENHFTNNEINLLFDATSKKFAEAKKLPYPFEVEQLTELDLGEYGVLLVDGLFSFMMDAANVPKKLREEWNGKMEATMRKFAKENDMEYPFLESAVPPSLMNVMSLKTSGVITNIMLLVQEYAPKGIDASAAAIAAEIEESLADSSYYNNMKKFLAKKEVKPSGMDDLIQFPGRVVQDFRLSWVGSKLPSWF